MTDNPLLHPVALGALTLQHRIVMAPMTRIRADRDTLAPTRDNADYYSQRASEGGLIITEAVHISPDRIRHGHDLTVYDRATFYSGSTAGYTDYPDNHDSAKAASYRMIAVSDVGASLPKADPQAKTYK